MNSETIRLTKYSHGAGCGCKIAPAVLDKIVGPSQQITGFPSLLVGNQSKDDAAAYELEGGQIVLSTTDFFMPICDDPFDFGRIAATNAISDIYAMGGAPIMAIAILGWPVNLLAPEVAGQVIAGGRHACAEAGIPLAGGHSIDAPEPIFGLAVTGQVRKRHLKRNDTAKSGDFLFLTKPLGIGVLTTAEKQGKLKPEHANLARDTMCKLNDIGARLAEIECVSAVTDVTGFGLMGHLIEMCEGSGLNAVIDFESVPTLEPIKFYLGEGCIPGGTQRNFESYGTKVGALNEYQKHILCDPQTSGGLLVAVSDATSTELQACFAAHDLDLVPIGRLGDLEGGARVRVE